MEWDFKGGVPIYSQIIDEMTMRIASGAYEPGEKLPSEAVECVCKSMIPAAVPITTCIMSPKAPRARPSSRLAGAWRKTGRTIIRVYYTIFSCACIGFFPAEVSFQGNLLTTKPDIVQRTARGRIPRKGREPVKDK